MRLPQAYSAIKLAVNASVDGEHLQLATPLDFHTWLPFAAKTYKISARIEDYVLRKIPLCPSDIPNRNGIAFPISELVRYQPPPTNRQVYKAWAGCPVHCFPAGTKISTSRGLKNIEDIEPGDKVWTHKGRLRPVTHLINNGIQPLKEIEAVGMSRPLQVTANHPMWVVDRRQVFSTPGVKGWGRKAQRAEITPHFREVSDIYSGDYLVIKNVIGGSLSVEPDFAFLTGVYTAEGNLTPTNTSPSPTGAIITLGYVEKLFRLRIEAACKSLGIAFVTRFHKEKGTCTITIRNALFAESMKRLVGCYSHKKRMKHELRHWDAESIKHFLGGYISGDGSTNARRLRISTTSENLALDVQMALGFIGIPASTNNQAASWVRLLETNAHAEAYYNSGGALTLKGTARLGKGGKPWRENNDAFCVGISNEYAPELAGYVVGKNCKRTRKGKELGPRIVVCGDLILVPVATIKDVAPAPVYNFEVETDHTYIAGGVVAHNCEHRNENPEDAYGVILDTSLTRITGFNQDRHWKVMGLIAVDKVKHPEMAQRVLDGDLTTGSMGALAESFSCSVCGAPAYDKENAFRNCSHITSIADVNWRILSESGQQKLAFLNAHGITPTEYSLVEDPAWCMSLSSDVFTL